VNWRFDLVLDRTPAKVAISIADLYDTSTPDITALMSFDNRERFKICRSYSGYFDNDISVEKIIHFKYRSGLVMESDGTVYAQNKILKNAYYLIYWTDVASNQPTLEGTARIVTLVT